MADTKKTYLIDFKDNLAAYAKRAADARLEVDRLKEANKLLLESGKATPAMIEKANAALRTAQQEYKNAQKNVDLATKANKAHANSYEELYRRWQLAQTQLKLMEGSLKRNADGTYNLTNAYIKQKKAVNDAKVALDSFGRGVHDNRLNVANYSEALEGALGRLSMAPGILGQGASQLQSFMSMFGKVGVVGMAAAAGIAAVSTPFIAFFKGSQEGIHLLEQKVSGLKAAWRVLKGEMIDVGRKGVEAFQKPAEEQSFYMRMLDGVWQRLKKAGEMLLWIGTAVIPGAHKWIGETAEAMDDAAAVAENYTKVEQELHKEERAMLVPRAKANLAIKEARLLYADATKSYEERIDAMQRAINMEDAQDAVEVAHAKKVVENLRIINAEKEKVGQLLSEDKLKLAEAEAHVYELQTESAGKLVRISKALANARAELRQEAYRLSEAEAKLREVAINMEISSYSARKAALKAAYDKMTADTGYSYAEREQLRKNYEKRLDELDVQTIQHQKELLAEQLALQLEQVDTMVQPEELANAQKLALRAQYNAAVALLDEQRIAQEREREASERTRRKRVAEDDIKAGFQLMRLRAEETDKNRLEQITALETVLDLEYGQMLASVEYEQMTANQKALIDEQYTQAKKKLSRERIAVNLAEMQALSSAMGDLANVFAEHTIAHKFFAIAQATIDTYLAAAQVMADWSSMTVVQKIAGVAAILAQGFTLINSIRNVSTGSGGSTQEAPIAPATSRILAQPVGASVTQPSANQQTNASVINANLMNDSILNAIRSMPRPIVTVEDINAKTAEMDKVEVRATI
jgi:plasmid maintenance system antidote protein VapI